MLDGYIKINNDGGECSAVLNAIRSGIPSAVFGINFAEKCRLAASLDAPVLYIVKDGLYAASARDEISAMTGEEVVYLPPKDDVLLYKNSFDKTALYARLSALYRIMRGARIVVATFESLLQLFPKELPRISVQKGGTYDLYDLAEKLVKIGYKRRDFADGKGTFAIRGDIFEVFPINEEKVYRVDFFGDEAESVRRYDPDEKDQKEDADGFTAVCATDVLIAEDEKPSIISAIRHSVEKFRNAESCEQARITAGEIIEKLDENATDDCLQFIMPLIENATDDLLSFMPDDTIVVYDECKMLAENLSAITREHGERFLSLSKNGRAMDFTFRQIGNGEKLTARLAEKRNAAFQTLTSSVKFFDPLKTFSIKCSKIARYPSDRAALYTDLTNWKFGGYKILICCGNAKRAETLYDETVTAKVFTVKSDTAELVNGGALVTTYYLPEGFVDHSEKLVVIGTGDLYLGIREEKRIKRRRGDVFQAPEVGDFAVHEVHGVGYVRGMKNHSGTSIAVHRIADGKSEATEFHVTKDTPNTGVPLKKIKLKKNVLIASILHLSQCIIPNGDSVFEPGDTVIVVSDSDKAISKPSDIFE
ncbi:MAG: hypothetical protein J5903_03830 [Clostridia bacterium]|nr:hypothetical protein [Clostridia bacterium]